MVMTAMTKIHGSMIIGRCMTDINYLLHNNDPERRNVNVTHVVVASTDLSPHRRSIVEIKDFDKTRESEKD